MTDFVLVHGGMHGAWCWGPLQEELAARGHRGVAVDVPLDDPAARMVDLVKAVVDGAAATADAVLVGHSLAGLIIPHVALARPFARLVFLCSMIAPRTPEDMEANLALVNPAFWAATGTDEQGRAVCAPEAAIPAFFHDVPPERAAWAASRLVPLAPAIVADVAFLDRFPDIRVDAVVTTEDAMSVSTERSCAHVRDRLGVEPALLPGGHSPFLSRPAALVEVLAP